MAQTTNQSSMALKPSSKGWVCCSHCDVSDDLSTDRYRRRAKRRERAGWKKEARKELNGDQ